MNETSSQSDRIEQGHEPDVANRRLILVSGAGLVLLIAIVLLLITGVIHLLAHEELPSGPQVPLVERETTVPSIQLSPDLPQQLHEFRAAEQQQLTSYQWIDEPAGLARIPIDRAIEILAERGLPQTKTTTTDEPQAKPAGEEHHDKQSN